MKLLSHEQAAELLFAAGLLPVQSADTDALIAEQYLAHHGDPATFAAELAAEYGDHPASAAARMRACLALTPPTMQVPDYIPADPTGGDHG